MSDRTSVVIPTFKRQQELVQLLRSLQAQTVPLEIHVMDDEGSDQTRAVVEGFGDHVHYHRLAVGRGPTYQRNRGAEAAQSEVVVFIDDDVVLPSTTTIERSLEDFDDVSIAVVAMPFVNINVGPLVHQRSSASQPGICVSYFGLAHAVKRRLFLEIGGYSEALFFNGEEGDLAIRLLAAGKVVRLGQADPVHHLESPKRSLERQDFFGRQNDVLFLWTHAPLTLLVPGLFSTVARGLLFGLREGRPWVMVRGMGSGFAKIWRGHPRRPVSGGVFRMFRKLKAMGRLPLMEVASNLEKSS